jgi:hypothetical protein
MYNLLKSLQFKDCNKRKGKVINKYQANMETVERNETVSQVETETEIQTEEREQQQEQQEQVQPQSSSIPTEINKDVFPDPPAFDESAYESEPEIEEPQVQALEQEVEEPRVQELEENEQILEAHNQQEQEQDLPTLSPVKSSSVASPSKDTESHGSGSDSEASFVDISHEAVFYISGDPKESLFYDEQNVQPSDNESVGSQAQSESELSDTDTPSRREPRPSTTHSRIGESVNQVMSRIRPTAVTRKNRVQFDDVSDQSEEELIIYEKPNTSRVNSRRKTPVPNCRESPSPSKKSPKYTSLNIWGDTDEVKKEADRLDRQAEQALNMADIDTVKRVSTSALSGSTSALPGSTTSCSNAPPTSENSKLESILQSLALLQKKNEELEALLAQKNAPTTPTLNKQGGSSSSSTPHSVIVNHFHYYGPTNTQN